MTGIIHKSQPMENVYYLGYHLWQTFWHGLTEKYIIYLVRSSQITIQRSKTRRNKSINLSDEISCGTAGIYADHCCIYTMIKSPGNCSTCGWLWVICWLWATSSHQTAIRTVCISLSVNICRVLSEPIGGCQWEHSYGDEIDKDTAHPAQQASFFSVKHSHSAERTRGPTLMQMLH